MKKKNTPSKKMPKEARKLESKDLRKIAGGPITIKQTNTETGPVGV
jgi:hypothetical protein